MSTYCNTLNKCHSAEYTEKGSRFIAYLRPCSNETEFNQHLAALKKKHPKARHHCYAWRFGENGAKYRANDDGEPSGTAGLPIYNQLQSFNVSNVALIVVRYFGGTLLGASGLIKAYKSAAQDALKLAKLFTIIPKVRIQIDLAYPEINLLMQLIHKENLSIIEQHLDINCRYIIEGERDQLPSIQNALTKSAFKFLVIDSQ